MLISFIGVFASETYSQTTKLSLKVEKITLEEFLIKIENQSEFRFFYTGKIDVEKKVSGEFKNKKITEILDNIKDEAGIHYEMMGRQIILSPKDARETVRRIQQQKAISGTVNDENGEPLPGVTVVVKGTNQGTVTNVDGEFSLDNIPTDATLQFSFVGMKTQDVNIENRSSIDVIMEVDAIGIEEVVAVGYGTEKRKDVTGAIASISADKISESKVTSFQEAIQGRLSGVQVSSSSGEPGSSVNISIRGANTVYGSSAPLYVIDGVPYDVNSGEVADASIGNGTSSNPLASLNPSSIESVEVLKDASATAIYGARGANGVIIITTKSGKVGDAKITYDGYVSLGTVTRKLPVLSADEYIEYRSVINPNTFLFYIDSNRDGNYNEYDMPRDPYELPMHDWQDEMLRVGMSNSHNLSISGGNASGTTFSGGIGYLDQNAIVIGNDYQRYNALLNLDHKHNNKLKLGLKFNMSYSELNGATQSGGGSGIFNGVVQNLVISRPLEFYAPNWDTEGRYISPLSMIDNAYKSISYLRNNLYTYLDYNVMKGLALHVSGGGFLTSSKGKEFYSKYTNWGNLDNGRAMLQDSKANSWNFTSRLNYYIRPNIHHLLKFMVAFEMNRYNWERMFIENADYTDESTGVNDISKGKRIKGISSDRNMINRLSYFGRLNYQFKGKHLLTATIRADGSDKLGPNNRFGYFPSLAYAWQIHNEPFMASLKSINNLKLRLGYGITGNDRIPSYRYLARMTNTEYGGELGMAPESRSNYDLKWEETSQLNFGLDIGLIKDRINITVDYYKKSTTDMLMSALVPKKTGFLSQWQNLGKVDNEGFEIQISTSNIQTKNFTWNTDFNLSSNKNTVKDLGDVEYIPVSIGGGWITRAGRVIEGESLGRAYGYVFDGVYQIEDFNWQDGSNPDIPHEERIYVLNEDVVSVAGINVLPGSFKFKDLSDDGVIDVDKDRTTISRSFPKHFGGINNSFKFKNFDLSVLLNWSYGNEIFNESKYRLEGGVSNTWMNITESFFRNRWTPENPTNEYGTFADDNWNKTALLASSYYVEDASYLRLQNVSLGYIIPERLVQKVGIDYARIYLAGTNLHTWTNYSGFDPEIDSGNSLLPGFDRLTYPRTKTFTFGVNLTF